ncbi:MAG TPA: outer membrane beta-barrel protein [Burkholderiales bacterium]|jgi:opacity protein-like surface antigen|nr:outer membrane beta-barrel protein [Burkholderiales bacterium]
MKNALIACLLAGLSLPGLSQAQENQRTEITPFAAVLGGGGFRDQLTSADLDVESSAAGGLILDFPWEPNSQLEIYLGRQPTSVEPDNAAPGPRFDLNVGYYHIGGIVLFEPSPRLRPYFVATIGATHFDPENGALDSELRFSVSAGVGAKYPLTDRLALRFEGRAFVTAMDSDSQIFCNLPGTCEIKVRSDTFVQWQALLGLSLGF